MVGKIVNETKPCGCIHQTTGGMTLILKYCTPHYKQKLELLGHEYDAKADEPFSKIETPNHVLTSCKTGEPISANDLMAEEEERENEAVGE